MKIDIIIYSKNTAVGVVLLKALEICAVAYIQEFEKSIDKEILEQLNHKCRWMIEDSKVVEHLKNNYESGDPIEIDDFTKYVMRLYKICCFGIPVNDVIEHDDNYAELAKYSDTGFVFVLYDQ